MYFLLDDCGLSQFDDAGIPPFDDAKIITGWEVRFNELPYQVKMDSHSVIDAHGSQTITVESLIKTTL